jgi:signal transduction histidine kinase
LRSSFAELEADEEQARRETLEAERLRTAFLAAMGHDLRGPLNSLIGFSDLLALEGLDSVESSLRPSVEIIRRSARDLLVLLDEILGWAKFEAGHITLDPVKTPLDEIVTDVANEAKERSGDRGLVVQCSVANNLPEVEVDKKRIVEALLGLLDHATRAPDRPRVSVSVWLATDEQQRASMRMELRDPQLRIREADQGHFFEAFRPSYAPSGKRVAGLGLGPALARALIRAHGGEVWFSSEAEKGTTFVVDLPLAFDDALRRAS